MKSILNPHLKSSLALFTMLCLTGISQGQLINVNFTGGGDSPPEMTLAGPAGGLGTTWNSVATVDTGALNDSTGAPTTVSIDTNYENITLGEQTSGTLPIFRSFANVFGRPNDNTVIINGLEPEGFYDIWILSYRDISTSATTERNVGTWTTSNTTTSLSSQSVNSQTASPDGTTFQDGYNYVLFENVQATVGGVISFTAAGNGAGSEQDGNSRRVHLNGLQIEKTIPPVVGVVVDAMSTVDASPASVFADGVLTSTVTVTLRDINGNGVPNKDVTLANTGGLLAATINPFTAVTTNGAGQAFFTVSSTTPGSEIFTATDVTDTLTLTDTASVTFVEIGVLSDAAQSTVVASPIARLADGLSASTITVTLRDANGYPVAGKDVDLTNSGGNMAATISPPGVVTSDINGQAEFSVSSSTIGSEQFTASDTTDNIGVTQIATVNFIDVNAPKLINVNFTNGSETGLEGPTGGPGLAWNQQGLGTSGVLLNSVGDTTTTVTTSTTTGYLDTWGSPALTVLKSGYLEFGKGVDFTVTISGLQADGTYDLWILTRSNGNGNESNFGTFRTSNTNLSGDQVIDSRSAYNGTTWVQGQNYAKFNSVVATGGTITFTSDGHDPNEIDPNDANSYRLMVNGLQMQKVAPVTGFNSWADANGATGQTPQQDHDNDGVKNGIEFFMGETGSSFTANPSLNASNAISWPASAAYLGTYEVQTSPDLATWTNVDPRPPIVSGFLTYELPAGAPGGKSFVRLLVTPTP